MIWEFKPGNLNQNTDALEFYFEGKWHHTQRQWQIYFRCRAWKFKH